jgi:hypothetical protein
MHTGVMRRGSLRLGFLGAAAGALLLALGGRAAGQRPGRPPAQFPYNGAEECKACHTQLTSGDQTGALTFVTLTEYAIWKTLDKHAQAYAVLKTERSQQMAKFLGNVTDPKTGCLNCHAMNALKTNEAVETFTPQDGVSCGGCHGPSSKWFAEHSVPAWRKNTPRQKAEKGMVDLRDPVVRATLCMSCHVGDASQGKVVTHAMFAAGHPPLPPFEVALFSRNLPQHWRDPGAVPFFHILKDVAALPAKADRTGEVRDVLKRYQKAGVDNEEVRRFLALYPTPEEAGKVLAQYPSFAQARALQTKLALVGNVVALRETLRLTAERAAPPSGANLGEVWPELARGPKPGEAKPEGDLRALAAERWPEVAMATSDCYACHHDLQYPGYRQKRGYGFRLPDGGWIPTTPGRPPVRAWPLALLGPELRFASPGQAAFDKAAGLLKTDLSGLAQACDARPFGRPEDVAKAARKLVPWCDSLLKELSATRPGEKEVRRLLQELCGMEAVAYADYESARQIAAVAKVAFDELYPKGRGGPRAREILTALEKDLGLRPYTNREKRQELIRKAIQKESPAAAPGAEQFFQSVEHIDDMDLLLKMIDNPFLAAVRRIRNSTLNELLQTGVVKELEGLNNEELKTALQKISNYDPALFKKRMTELGQLLAEKTKD